MWSRSLASGVFPLLLLLILLIQCQCHGGDDHNNRPPPPPSSEISSFSGAAVSVAGRISRNTKPKPFDFRCLERPKANSEAHLKFLKRTLVIHVSRRVLPQLVSRIFALLLQNVVDTGVEIHIQTERIVKFSHTLESGKISLETWQMPDDHEGDKGQNNHHGPVYDTTGVFGWFVPRDSIKEGDFHDLMNYKIFQGSISEDIWRQFQMEPNVKQKLTKLAELDPDSNAVINQPIQSFSPKSCQLPRARCVTLLAGYQEESNFLVSHINAFNFSVEVIWFGRNLRRAVKLLHETYQQLPGNKKFLVFEKSPSVVIDGSLEFEAIQMPNCREILNHKSFFCAYDHMPVLKFYKIEASLPQVLEMAKKFKIEEKELKELIRKYEKKIDSPKEFAGSEEEMLNQLACEFVKESGRKFLARDNSSQGTNSFMEMKIGLLLPKNPSIYGDIQRAALEAIRSVNRNQNVLPHINLTIAMAEISCDGQSMLNSYLTFHTLGNMIGVVGPPCSRGLDSVSTFAKVIGMTTISYGATLSSFGENNEFRNFFRTTGESRFFSSSALEFLKKFNWKRVATLTEDGLLSSYISVNFDRRLKEEGIDILINHKLTTESSDSEIEDRLKDLKERKAKIILMEIYDVKMGLQVVCLSKKLEMTAKEGFVWILPSWFGEFNFGGRTDFPVSCSRGEVADTLEHQFSFHFPAFGEDTQLLQHLNNSTIGNWITNFQNSSEKELELSNYSGFIFDAVWTFAFALDRLWRNGIMGLDTNIHKIEVNERFLEEIRKTNFTGVTGQVDFHSGHSRRPQVILSQWRKDLRLENVGTEDLRSKSVMIFKDHLINWENGGNDPPSDGRMICSVQSTADLLNTDCDSAIVVIIVFASITMAFCACLLFYFYVRRFYNQKIKLSAQVMRNLGIDLMNTSRAPENLLVEWELPKDQIMLNRKLGEGAFGTVYGGQAYIDGSQDLKAVAVKTLKVGSTAEDRMDFLSEAEAMKKFNHPNILKLLGVCLQSEPIFSVIEFMLYGDLKTYLLARRHLVKERIPDDSDVSPKRLTSMVLDIVRGLVYLAEQKYVHRDIACRNCLVNADRKVKIADFGMARPTGSNDYYRFSRKGLLPVRWLSPESLGSGFFIPASDIWSFGVLLYEIITFGSFPYQGMSNNQVLDFVKNGGSMDIPEGVKPPLAKLMKSCWAPDYKQRPSAQKVLEFIANNPRLVSPCVDIPTFSIQFSDCESDQMDFGGQMVNQSPDSGIGEMGVPITRETLQALASMPTSQAAADAFQMRINGGGGGGKGGFFKANETVPNGDSSLNYNPVEPLLLRQNSNEMSSSSSSLLRYVPMCGFNSKKVVNVNYVNESALNEQRRSSDEDYAMMSITEF